MKKVALAVIAIALIAAGCNVRKIGRRIYSTHAPNAPYDVVIIPGMPYDSTTQQKKGFNARVIWAKKLYDWGLARNIIFSGAACYTPYVEAEVMKEIAIAMGVPAKNVFTEPKAEHSKENVYYSYLMARKMGFNKIAFGSDPYQSFFLEGFIQANVPEMGILPIDVDSLKKYYLPVPKVDLTGAYVDSFIPLNKRETFMTRVKHTNHNTLPDSIPAEYLK